MTATLSEVAVRALTFMGAVRPNIAAIAGEVLLAAQVAGHQIRVVWGFNPKSTPEHSAGTALDFMTYQDTVAGNWIADYLWTHRARLGLRWEIWRQRVRSTSPGKPDTWQQMADRGSTTANHYDHVHANFWVKSYDPPAGGGSAPVAPKPTALKPTPSWDGKSFPGVGAFVLGQSHPAVTLLGQRLIAHGFGQGYRVGPGPVFTAVDRDATRRFQLAQGYTGTGADGYPGPQTWAALMAAPRKPAPAPSARPRVSLAAVQKAARLDPPRPQGGTTPGSADDVRVVEAALRKVGLLDARYSSDGSFGTSSVRAYSAWQRQNGAVGRGADGVPGRETLAKLGARAGFDVVA